MGKQERKERERGRKERGTREGEDPRKCMAEIARLYRKEKLGRGKGRERKEKEGSGEVLGREQGQEMMRRARVCNRCMQY